MPKNYLEIASKKIEKLETAKRLIEILNYNLDYEYEYEKDENENSTWEIKKDSDGNYIKHLCENSYNEMIDELINHIVKTYF